MASRIELAALAPRYDLIIIGGGITGAGILRESMRTGAKVLLVEQGDFAAGTSSASSKLVHGGLRYLRHGHWRLTLESVRERQRLMNEAPGLIEPQPFLMPIYRGIKPGKWIMRIGLWLYDWMAKKRGSRWLNTAELLQTEPHIRRDGLLGAVNYEDARTDDARLVLRLIFDSVDAGATALNYVQAALLRDKTAVTGVKLTDVESGATREIQVGLVINATGAWAGALAGAAAHAPKLRPLRGSHLVFPLEKLPVQQAVSWMHPQDRRPIFAYPWEGAVVYGTTDLDHAESLSDPRISAAEALYLMQGLTHQFPELHLSLNDAVASYAGVRPVVAGGGGDPSSESRESAMWSEPGLVGITGGKLTTFRVTARQVLREAAKQQSALAPVEDIPVFAAPKRLDHPRLRGRLGSAADALLQELPADELQMIAHTPYTWAELRWAMRYEQVVHLDDLLLRRTRIGLVMAGGGREILPQVMDLCWAELGWDEARCSEEEARYLAHWQRCHAPVSA